MKFLIDECLAPRVAQLLNGAGHTATHAAEVGLLGHPDTEVMAHAHAHGQVVVSADTDFGELLALTRESLPSVILLRRNHDAVSQAAGILAALPDIEDSLRAGAIVAITPDRVRIRALAID